MSSRISSYLYLSFYRKCVLLDSLARVVFVFCLSQYFSSPPSVAHNLTISLLSSSEQFALEKPLETALLMSLGGVGCIVLNQWQTSLQQNTQNMAKVLDSRCWT